LDEDVKAGLSTILEERRWNYRCVHATSTHNFKLQWKKRVCIDINCILEA